MKKFLAILLALVMVLSLVACAAKEEAPAVEEPKEETTAPAPAEKEEEKEEEKVEEPAAEEQKTVTIMWPETDSTQVGVMEALQPALAEQFPNVTFEFTGMPLNQDSPLKTMSASGDLPDIWYTGGGDMDALLAAGDCLDLAQYVDAAWIEENYNNPGLIYNGDAVYFMCPGQNAYYSPVFYYNKAIFADNGIEVPTNMDEFVAACQTLVDAGVTPITTASWVSSASLISGIISAADPAAYKALTEGSLKWTDDEIVNALSYFDDLKLMGAFAADTPNKDDATAYAEFQNGSAAMLLTYSWFNGDIVADKLGFEAGSFSFPNAGDDYIQLIFEPRKGCGCGYTANANSEDPALLAEIMKVIVNAESEFHNSNGVSTNFKVANPAVAPNDFEAARFADYDRAAYQISVLYQANMDGATIAEFTTLYNMLMSADMEYLSDDFIAELQPIWDMNTKAAS